MKIKIAIKEEGIVVRDPIDFTKVTTSGKIVDKTVYWIRRIKSGDVIELPLNEGEQYAD